MLEGFRWRSPEDASDRKMLSDVREFGWHVVRVFDDRDPARPEPDFAFSVGLYLNHEHPEIVLMGLPHWKPWTIINAVGEYVRAGGRIKPGERYAGFIEGREVMFRPVQHKHYSDYLGSALWFYHCLRGYFPALQMVWPDGAGIFPWEADFDQNYARWQHQLW